ncbi:hypothetical protein D3C80_1223680 [compost metagenome]
MNVAFVQHTQDQIHRHQRPQNHPRLTFLGRRESVGCAGHFRDHVFRQADLGNRPLDGGTALLHGHAFGHVEGNALRSKLAFVADPVVFQAVFVMGDGRQRDSRAVSGDHLDLREGDRVLGVLRIDLHHHLVLIKTVVDGRNLPLTVGVVQHRRDHVHVDTQALGLVAVDDQGHLPGAPAFPRIDRRQLRQGPERGDDFRIPLAQCPQIPALQDVRVLRGGLLTATTELQVLVRHEHQLCPGNLGHFLAQAFDDFLRGNAALLDRLEAHQHEGVVGAVIAANEPGDAFYRLILQHRTAENLHLRLHHTERQAVVAAHETDQLTGILLR